MEPQMAGLIGGIAGGAIGLMGGAIGTYFSIKNVRTEAERRFMIRCAVAMWIGLVGFVILPACLVVAKLVPSWAAWCLWLPFMLIAIRMIPRLNRRAAELGGYGKPPASPLSE